MAGERKQELISAMRLERIGTLPDSAFWCAEGADLAKAKQYVAERIAAGDRRIPIAEAVRVANAVPAHYDVFRTGFGLEIVLPVRDSDGSCVWQAALGVRQSELYSRDELQQMLRGSSDDNIEKNIALREEYIIPSDGLRERLPESKFYPVVAEANGLWTIRRKLTEWVRSKWTDTTTKQIMSGGEAFRKDSSLCLPADGMHLANYVLSGPQVDMESTVSGNKRGCVYEAVGIFGVRDKEELATYLVRLVLNCTEPMGVSTHLLLQFQRGKNKDEFQRGMVSIGWGDPACDNGVMATIAGIPFDEYGKSADVAEMLRAFPHARTGSKPKALQYVPTLESIAKAIQTGAIAARDFSPYEVAVFG